MKQHSQNVKGENCLAPSLQQVTIYFEQKDLPTQAAEGFFRYHQARKWKTKTGMPIRSWKTVANNWIWMHQQNNRYQTIEIKLRLQIPPGYQAENYGR